MLPIRLILFCKLLLFSLSSNAQIIEQTKSPTKASIFSAILPGAGQIYNEKYWKTPVIYIGMGTALFIANWNKNEYQHYRTALANKTDGNDDTVDLYQDIYSESNLITMKNYHRKNRDLGYIITVGIYLLNIIDASVDAHLFNFNVNDNLGIRIQPQISRFQNNNLYALSVTLNLKK